MATSRLSSENSGQAMTAALLDTIAEELGAITGRMERDARLRVDALIADVRRIVAESELRLANLERLVTDRLATVKDGAPGRNITVEDAAPVIAAEVARQVAALPPGEPGRSVTVDEVRPVLAEMVAALPPAEPGKSVTVDELRPVLAELVAALPPAEPGRSLTVEEVAPVIAAEVARQVAALPPAEPGRSVTVEEVAPVIADEVARQVAALPQAEPGKSVTVDDVRPVLEELVAALPPAEPGRSVTVEEVAPVIAAEVARQVGALPPAEPGKSVTVDDVRPVLAELVAALPPAEPGPRGERGPEGRLSVAKAWSDRVHYEGEIVTHNGATWQAQCDTGREPPHDDWICLAAAGQNGRDGRSPRVRDTFDAAVTDYRELDIVALGGAAFIARHDNPGPCPGVGWKQIAMQGKTGKPGERGGVGQRGPAGPAVVALDVTDQGLLTVTNGDGSTVELDMYPLLSKLQG